MKILSPAKINLFLEVGALYQEFHEILSLVEIVDLYDHIEIKESDKTEVSFFCDWNIPPENTISKSIRVLKNKYDIKRDVAVRVIKNIPPGSGLAGGSSNAAAVIKALIKIWEIDAAADDLSDISLSVGSDVPLFLSGRRCLVEGFGEKISLDDIPDTRLAYSLLIPDFHISTKEVYGLFDSMGLKGDLTKGAEKIKLLLELIRLREVSEIEDILFNRLEKPYLNLNEGAQKIKKEARIKTGKRFFTSGSGGTLFAVFSDKSEAVRETSSLNFNGWERHIVESIFVAP